VTRLYLPMTLDLLAEVVDEGRLPAGWSVERMSPPTQDEDGEYVALMWAAEASAELLPDGGRRVVLVAEGETSLRVEVTMGAFVAVYADPEDRPSDADPEDDLCWYATQEIPELLDRN
jgi:redox-sensitive bicupin YhaK (pirin superfamily)